jgi:protein involved in temperature-dependent protein secretion
VGNIERELVSTDDLLDHALRHMEAVHKHNVEPLMEARVLVEAARRQHADQLRGAVEALREAADELDMLGPGVTRASVGWLRDLADRLRAAAERQ